MARLRSERERSRKTAAAVCMKTSRCSRQAEEQRARCERSLEALQQELAQQREEAAQAAAESTLAQSHLERAARGAAREVREVPPPPAVDSQVAEWIRAVHVRDTAIQARDEALRDRDEALAGAGAEVERLREALAEAEVAAATTSAPAKDVCRPHCR